MNFPDLKSPEKLSSIPGHGLFWAIASPLVFITIVLPLVLSRIVRWLLNINLNIIVAIFRDTVTFILIVVNEVKCFDSICSEFSVFFVFFNICPSGALFCLKCFIPVFELSMVDVVRPDVRLLFQWAWRERMVILDLTFSFLMVFFYWNMSHSGDSKALNYMLLTLFLLWRVGSIWQMYRELLEISDCSKLS